MGRPVVLPRTNIGLLVHDRINALLMQRGDAAEITECVESLLTNAARLLEGFYRDVLRH
jgi:hypothetical protein